MFWRILAVINAVITVFLAWMVFKLAELCMTLGLSLDFLAKVLLDHVENSVISF